MGEVLTVKLPSTIPLVYVDCEECRMRRFRGVKGTALNVTFGSLDRLDAGMVEQLRSNPIEFCREYNLDRSLANG
jgi:hypothetical protein